MIETRFWAGVLAASALMSALVGGHAAAQTSAPAARATPPSSSDQAASVGEVVVTALKREQAIRSVPATVTAVTAAQLQATGPVSGTGDLLRTVPGVRFNDLESPNLSEISIRGSGTERATGADSGVGLFVNGAYVGSSTLGGRNFTTLDLFDIDRVEVLEGPQGALYGRNAEYGEVNIVEAEPVFRNTGYFDETFISGLDQNRVSGVVNQQINDDLAVRIGAQSYGQTGGFYYNPIDNKYYDQTNGGLARGQIRYKNGPLDVDLLVDAQDLNLPTFVNSYVVPPGKVATLPLGYTANRFTVPENGVNSTKQEVERAQLLVNYDLGWGVLTSTTMLRRFISDQAYASAISLNTEAMFQKLGEVGVYPFGQTTTNVEDKTLYQDLHLAGSAFGSRLNWLVGGEVLDQSDNSLVSAATSPCALALGAGICGGSPATPVCYEVLPTSKPCPAKYPLPFGASSVTPQSYLSEAVYGSLKYQLGWGFSLSGEARITHDDKSASTTTYDLDTTTLDGKPSSYSFDAVEPSYAVTLSYLIPGAWRDLLYAKVGSGYRAGGINAGLPAPLAPVPFRPTYGDEYTTSYEAGLKGNLTSHVYFTLDGYFSRTSNAIASISDGCTALTCNGQGPEVFNINAGVVHAHGVEGAIDSSFHVLGGQLSLDANAAAQKATYVSLVSGGYAGLPVLGSLVAQIPAVTASATFNYIHPITDSMDGFLNVVYNGQWGGGQDTVTTAVPFNPLSDIGDVTLRTGVDYKHLQFAFFVQNLTNQTVTLLQLQLTGIPVDDRYNEPRTFGVDVNYKW